MKTLIVTMLFILFALLWCFGTEKLTDFIPDKGWMFFLKIAVIIVSFVIYLLIIRNLQDAGIDVPYGN